jgi:hypothetical protein
MLILLLGVYELVRISRHIYIIMYVSSTYIFMYYIAIIYPHTIYLFH